MAVAVAACSRWSSLLVPALVAFVAAPAAARQQFSELLRARVELIHDGKAAGAAGVSLLQPDAVAHFFQGRNFTPAWAGAAPEILQAIRDAERDGLNPQDYHPAVLERLLALPATPQRDVDLQILLTDSVAALVDHVRFGKVLPVTLDRRWNVNPREGAEPLEKIVADVAAARSLTSALEALKPSHFIYQGLKRALASYRAIAAAGGWPTVPAGAAIKPGMSDPRVGAVRGRLSTPGDSAANPGSPVYDDELVARVKAFQERHRLTADGVIGRSTLEALNVSAESLVNRIRVNLERARWVVGGSHAAGDTFVLVNLPAFKAYVIRDGKNVWETRAQVGQAGRQTPAFRADIRYLVFNPDWTVPPTILAKDILVPMRRGQNVIARKRLVILDRQGRRVSPSSIDWASATPGNFPYVLRQPPGPDGALGRVKFVFPNEHTIFLHDTPSQELFTADERTFSSGCIRVEHALDLAAVLLDGQDDWSPAKIQDVVDTGATETVFLDRPLPILIVYWTVSVSATGELRYARDVYRLDDAVLRALNAPPRR